MSKKINQLDAATDAEAKNDSWLDALADPTNGIAKRRTTGQSKEVFSTKKLKYVATGAEGSTLTIPEIAGYDILLIVRESGPIFEVGTSPDSSEFTWDDTDIVLGAAVGGAGERFLILYKTY